jgi:predicted nucleic acid-binding protein
MITWVVDASVAVKWFVPELLSDQAGLLLEAGSAGHSALIAPDLVVAEFGSVLSKKMRAGELTSREAREVLDGFLAAPVEFVSSAGLAHAGLEIAAVVHCTFYDALYLATAQAVRGRLVTADEGLARLISRTPLHALLVSLRSLAREF